MLLIGTIILSGCQTGKKDTAPCKSEKCCTLSVSGTEEASTAASPPNEYRRRLTREAMRGLLYDSGRVVIDTAVAGQIIDGRNAEHARVEFKRGQELLRHNRSIEMLAAFTKAVLFAPDVAEYYEGLGGALLMKRKFPQAAAAFRTALDLNPDSVSARYGLADALGRQGQRDAAIAMLEELLDRDPQHAEAHARLAIESYYQGETRRAEQHVAAAEASGRAMPPQFLQLLRGEMEPAEVATLSRAGTPIIGAQIRADNGNNGPSNETSIAASEYDPFEVVATWNDYREGSARLGVGLSQDGGATWDDFLVRPPAAYQAPTEGDPMTAIDPRTGALWVGAISFDSNGGVYTARKDYGSSSFKPTVMAEVTGGADKCWMAAGPVPGNPNTTRVYIAYNEGLLISTDMGDSWSGPDYLDTGLGFLPRIGPNGELYILYWNWSGAGDRIELIRSYDGGDSLSSSLLVATRMDVWGVDGTRFPGSFRVAPMAHLAVDPNTGTLYCVYFDTTNIVSGNSNVDLYFTKSTNEGTSWTTPVIINSDAVPPGDQFFPWIEVDQSGRIHMVFFDTRAVAQDDEASADGYVRAYYAYSDDAGDSWKEMPMSATFNTAYDGFGGGFLGDYLGLAVARCRSYACYPDTTRGTADVFVNTIISSPFADITSDGYVNLEDLQQLLANYGTTSGAAYEDGDLTEDGAVNLADLQLLLSAYGTSCN